MAEIRKLAAIMVVDVVGFSRMAGADEERTLARLRTLRSDLLEPTISVHNGRIVKGTGDGALVEFRSVVDCVRCSIEIQQAMVERNAGVPSGSRIEFRIGIHVGDVVEESDGDLMGDGVNIAARLEGMAKPGGICLSEDVYRQVRSKLALTFGDLGIMTLKNIADPVRLYSLAVGTEVLVQPAVPSPAAPQTSGKAGNSAMREKPSIAVLPFTNMSGDADQEYFVDGMVEDIITALSRFDELFVIARNSSFVYKGRAVDVKQVSRDLGVRYVLEGSVRKSGDRLRITGQLIEGENGSHLWADRFDGQLEDVFDLQDRITANVIGAIEPTIRKAEIDRARHKPADSLDAYDLYLRAIPHVYAIRPDDNLIAIDLLNRAIEIDPVYAPALAHLGWCLVQRITRSWAPIVETDRATAVALAHRALASGRDDAVCVVIGGFVLVMVGRNYSTGLPAVRRAIRQNPGSAFVNAMAGVAMVFGDELEAGLSLLERAMLHSPLDPNLFSHLAVSSYGHLFCGRPEMAAEMALSSIALNSEWDSSHWALVAAYIQLDRLPEACAAVEKILVIMPDARVSKYQKTLPFRNTDQLNVILEALRKAGLPE